MPQGVNFNVTLENDKIKFDAYIAKQEFELKLEKVTNIYCYGEAEIQNIVGQSASGMILGGMIAGAAGAAIGGRVKTKQKQIVNCYVTITYEDKTIIINTHHYPSAKKFIDEFNKIKPLQHNTINL